MKTFVTLMGGKLSGAIDLTQFIIEGNIRV